MSNVTFAREPIVTHEALLATNGELPIHPEAINSVDDGGVIVTGSAGFDGWAVKTDAEGKVQWSYSVKSQDKSPRPRTVKILDSVLMPDKSFYLCVDRSLPFGSHSPGSSLIHLDPSGRLLSEKFFSPKISNDTAGVGSAFSRCVKWGDGLVLVGRIGKMVREASSAVPPVVEKFYWILALDASGGVKWELVVPCHTKSIATFGPLVIADRTLAFSSTDVVTTDVVLTSVDGHVIIQKSLKGAFNFVTPVVPDDDLQMIGFTHKGENPDGTNRSFVMSLDEKLEETGRTSSVLENFLGKTFRLADGSYVIVGSRTHSIGQRKTCGVLHVNSSLGDKRELELPRTREPVFIDGGSVAAAAPGQLPGDFVMVRTSLERIVDSTPYTSPVFRGAVVDFVRIH